MDPRVIVILRVVFPETRTALRTYHPIPALSKSDGNLQDAPRIKNALKACALPSEAKGAPSTPSDILLQGVRHIILTVNFKGFNKTESYR